MVRVAQAEPSPFNVPHPFFQRSHVRCGRFARFLLHSDGLMSDHISYPFELVEFGDAGSVKAHGRHRKVEVDASLG